MSQEKLSIIKELIKLAKSDLDLREIEFQFLLQISNQLGISEEDFKNIFEENIDFEPPKLEFERIIQFHRLVLLMNVDQESNANEIIKIKEIGIRLGLNSLSIDEVLIKMNHYENKVIPPNVLIEIFTRNFN